MDNNKLLELARQIGDEKYRQNSKKRLMTILERKFKTTMIGALAKFEEGFGKLWGLGKSEDKLTEDELRWMRVWQLVRTEVLNNGNNQCRATMDELAEYTISWNRYKTTFIIKEQV